MRKIIALIAAGLILGASGIALAASSQTQTVTYEVQSINELAVSGAPSLIITTASAGSPPTAVTDVSATYAFTTNTGGKITGALGADLSAGLTLSVTLAAPTGATAGTDVALTGTAADLVTAIPKLNDPSKSITYKLAATAAAGVIAHGTTAVVT